MTSTTIDDAPFIEPSTRVRRNYINDEYGVLSWLLTKDHKRIAILYLISVTIFFIVGGVFAFLMRLELLTPEGDMFTSDQYNKLFTLHGIVMIFFFLIPAIPAVMGNFILPIMLGAKDLAFPKINLLSWYVYMIGGTFGVIVIITGGVDTGWTFYTPFSTQYSNTKVFATTLGAFITGFSSILTALNFLVTIHRMRAPGLTWFRLPLFVWSMYATSVVIMLATPVLAITLVLLMVERALQVGIFDPALGGDPVLYQHMFWFYSHPAVYIMILPGMAVISECVAAFTRKKIFGYKFVAFSSLAIAFLGFLVWAHHMFVAGMSVYSAMIFSFLTMLVAVPSAIKVFNWTATMYKASVSWQTPMLYVMGFIGLFTIGGVTGLFLGALGVDVHVHDSYFVVAHFHYIMVGGTIMAYMAGLHYWWPKMTGRMYPEWWGRLSALLVFVGFNLTFFPQFLVGYVGMPRRYHAYAPEFQVLNVLSTAGATVLAAGYLLPMIYLAWSLKFGRRAGANPWGAAGLEWATSSPPPKENFHETPAVTWDAYDYPAFLKAMKETQNV
ncbi:MAG TPA: cytochrome c oxidase subunit I [Thermoanaerobaculia bacterium]|jgi:cytochrome c oxidase subunit 1